MDFHIFEISGCQKLLALAESKKKSMTEMSLMVGDKVLVEKKDKS